MPGLVSKGSTNFCSRLRGPSCSIMAPKVYSEDNSVVETHRRRRSCSKRVPPEAVGGLEIVRRLSADPACLRGQRSATRRAPRRASRVRRRRVHRQAATGAASARPHQGRTRAPARKTPGPFQFAHHAFFGHIHRNRAIRPATSRSSHSVRVLWSRREPVEAAPTAAPAHRIKLHGNRHWPVQPTDSGPFRVAA